MPALNSSPADHLLIFTITTTTCPPQTRKHEITSSKTTRYMEELGLEPCLIPDLRFSPTAVSFPRERRGGDGCGVGGTGAVKILMFSWSRRKAFNPETGSFQPCGPYFGRYEHLPPGLLQRSPHCLQLPEICQLWRERPGTQV